MDRAFSKGLLGLSLLAIATSGQAVPTFYTSKASFDTAIAGIAPAVDTDVIDFEDQATGTTYPTTTNLQGITFTYSIAGGTYDLGVRGIGGTSGSQTLAVTNDGGSSFAQFALGDSVDLAFDTATHALGMYIIVNSETFDFLADDVNLMLGASTFSLDGSETASLVNGVAALFVGIVDPDATYTAGNLTFGAASGGAYFEVDDIFTTSPADTNPPPPGGGSAPVPGTLLLMAGGLIGLFGVRACRRGAALPA